MNKSFKSIWCEHSGTFVAVAEISRAKGKKSSSGVVATAIVAIAGLTGLMAGLPGVASAEEIDTPVQATNGTYSEYSTTASATGTDATAVGAASIASDQGTTAIGAGAEATAENATALGILANASAIRATALGWAAQASGQNSTSIGQESSSAALSSIAIGDVASVSSAGTNGISIGTGGLSVDFTGSDGARVLSGVGAGNLAVDSQEAVNGSQLFATNENVQANTANIATNTSYIATNTTNIANNRTAIEDMGGRVSSVENSMSSLSQQLETTHQTAIEKFNTTVQTASNSHVATGGDASQAAVASGDNTVAIGAGATASASNSVALGGGSQTGNRENIVSVGSAGNERAIANVADAVMDTDAVNKRQLDAVSASSQAYTDERINQVQSDIASVKRDSNGAAAAAMAVATLPQSIIPGRGMASAAVSTMDGESAVAVGVSKVAENSRWVTKLAGTVNTRGKLGVSAGIGFHW